MNLDKQKMLISTILAAVLLAFTVILIVRRRKKSTAVVTSVPPVVTGSTGAGTGTGTGTATPTLTITGVGQTVTGLTNPQTVTAPVRVINLLATPAGTYSGSATLKNAAGAVLHTEPLNNLDISASGYPAVYFNPQNSTWGITTPGTYTMEVAFNVNGTNCTATTPLIITAADLGQNPVNPPTNPPPASSVRTDLINVVKNPDTGLYSNVMPDVIGNYIGYFFVNGIPYLNPDGSRRNYLNVPLRAGLVVEVSVVFLDQSRYPNFALWLSEGWKTKIQQEQIQINGTWVNATDALKAANPTAPTRITYPNDNWVLDYGQHNFVTA